MKKIAAAVLLLTCVSSFAVTAMWTGASRIGNSVSGAIGFHCEYYYAGKKFWLFFSGSCPSSVEVE